MADEPWADFLEKVGEAYKKRRVPEPGPRVLLAAAWQVAACLTEAEMQGRPATREELNRAASEFLREPVVIEIYGEKLDNPVH